MDITWYGLSCFRLAARGLASVVTDPYQSEAAGYPPLSLRGQIVTVSQDAPLYNNVGVVKGRQKVLTGPGEYEIGGVFITALRTNGSKRRKADERPNTLYVFDYDGLNIAHLGNLYRVPSQAQIEAMGNVHIALVPVGNKSGLNAAKAAEVVSLLEPGIVIPMHYHTPGCALKLDTLDKFLKEMGVGEVKPQNSLSINLSSVPEDTQVVVLSPQVG